MPRAGSGCFPDPAFDGVNASTGRLDSSLILAANRLIPIEPAPNYTEGFATIDYAFGVSQLQLPYPGDGGGYYPLTGVGCQRLAPARKRV